MDTQTQQTIDIWKDDLLNRGEDAVFLHNFLIGKMAERQTNSVPGSYVLNIDAEWGAGKTFFLNKFGKYLEEQGHIVVTIDAWRDDYVDDPFVAVLAAIDERLKPFYKAEGSTAGAYIQKAKKYAVPIIMNTAKGMLKTALKKRVGTEDFSELLGIDEETVSTDIINNAASDLFNGIEKLTDQFTDHMITKFTEQEKASLSFRQNLSLALNELQNGTSIQLPLFILVDELDRCRPTYAVALLERVKHLFDIDNVVFVFGTNNDQLQHSITGAYGPSFDGYRYLKRFFEKTYKLETAALEPFVQMSAKSFNYSKIEAPGTGQNTELKAVQFLSQCCKVYNLDLRDIQHILDIIQSVITAWPHENVKLDLAMLFPLAHNYYKYGKTGWQEAYDNIPSNFILNLGYFSQGKEQSINISTLFNCYINAIKSTKNAYDLINSNQTSNAHIHTSRVIEREVNGRNTELPSRFLKLTSQIVRAGQLNENNIE